MQIHCHKQLRMRLGKNKKFYFIYLNNELIIKQRVFKSITYTFMYLMHFLIRLGLITINN
jgi:hypothetical protein